MVQSRIDTYPALASGLVQLSAGDQLRILLEEFESSASGNPPSCSTTRLKAALYSLPRRSS